MRSIYPAINSLCAHHSLEHPERFTELHREEKREEGDRGDLEEKRGSQKRETDLASNQFPKFSPPSGTYKEIPRVGQRREGGGRR